MQNPQDPQYERNQNPQYAQNPTDAQRNPQNPQYAQQNPAYAPSGPARGAAGTLTNTSDKHYDLVSVLYHALESAQHCAQYVEDANKAGDRELSQFFLQVQQEEIMCAEKAKQLLARRVTESVPR
jgi:hypothetical protein